MSKIDPNKWYTAAEAAPFLDVKEQTVTRYCREGMFGSRRARKIGSKRKWHVQGSAIMRKRVEWGLQ
jgi:hypothetical protein